MPGSAGWRLVVGPACCLAGFGTEPTLSGSAEALPPNGGAAKKIGMGLA
jgi:hypothetical protein